MQMVQKKKKRKWVVKKENVAKDAMKKHTEGSFKSNETFCPKRATYNDIA